MSAKARVFLNILCSPALNDAVRKHLMDDDRGVPLVVEIVGCVRDPSTTDAWCARVRCDNEDFDFAIFEWDGARPIEPRRFYEVAYATWPPMHTLSSSG